MKYYYHIYLTANHIPMVNFRRAFRPDVFNDFTFLYFVDRMNIIGNDANIEVMQPIENYDITKKYNFNQLVEDRALELIELSNQRNVPIQLMWSGGIDSTSVYCALKMHLKNPNQLIILGNDNSRREYPKLYQEIITNHQFIDITIDKFNENLNQLINDKSITVTGEICDQLFSAKPMSGPYEKIINWTNDSWRILLNPKTSEYHQYAENYVSNFPTEITTAQEFGRSLRFNMRYQEVQLRMCARFSESKLNHNLFHFFDNRDFNHYALGLPLEEMGMEDSARIKLPLKRLILEYTNDQEYYDVKLKTGYAWSRNMTLIQANCIDVEWNKKQLKLNYSENQGTDYILDQPCKYPYSMDPGGVIINNHNNFSEIKSLIDWKVYRFRQPISSSGKPTGKSIIVCGYQINKSKTKDNFFVFVGEMVSILNESAVQKTIILKQNVNELEILNPVKIVGDEHSGSYDVTIQTLFLPDENCEPINPTTFNFNS